MKIERISNDHKAYGAHSYSITEDPKNAEKFKKVITNLEEMGYKASEASMDDSIELYATFDDLDSKMESDGFKEDYKKAKKAAQ